MFTERQTRGSPPPHPHTMHIPLRLEKVSGRHEAGVDLEHNIRQEDKAINILRYYKFSQVMLLIHDELYGIVGLTEITTI